MIAFSRRRSMGRMTVRAVREATAAEVVRAYQWEEAMEERVGVKHPPLLVASPVVQELEDEVEPIIRPSDEDVGTRRNRLDQSSIPMRTASSTGWHSLPFGSFTICGPLSSASPFLNCSKATISARGIYATH